MNNKLFSKIKISAPALMVMAVVLAACAAPTAPPPQIVVQTAVVTSVVEKVKEVSKEVVITATPVPVKSTQDDKAPVVVWIDDTRKPLVEAFKKKYPDKAALIKEEVVDRGTFPAKVLLFNNTGKGWPDVVFAEPNLVSQVADSNRNFPHDLTNAVPKEIIDQFAPGALAPCTFGGKLLCLRNDLAQNMIWFNKPLFEQFKYKVPTTWAEYEQLGELVAKEHPGYIIGALDEASITYVYLWGSRCPLGHARDVNTLYINLEDPKCTRAIKMMDNLTKLGVLAKVGNFDPAVAKLAGENKVLMMVGPSWFGEYVFGGKPESTYYKKAEGQLDTAVPMKWDGEDKNYTGFWGGSAWSVSRHAANLKLAVEFAIFASTAVEYHGTGPTYPAFAPSAVEWRKTLNGNPLYAQDPYPIMEKSAAVMDPLITSVRFNQTSPFKDIAVPAITKGQTIESVIPALQKALVGLAAAQGYNVVTK
ncbi:MAG: ABC transporter substrate-binding protein [Chloroflexota bacterium]|jgi:multiple sugar transport system substrate-binding protein